MSNHMYDHKIRDIVSHLSEAEVQVLRNEIDDVIIVLLQDHVKQWWYEKAMQLSDPLRVFFTSHNNECCPCFMMLAIDVLNAFLAENNTKLFDLPHSNGRIQKNCIGMMKFMELYKFTN